MARSRKATSKKKSRRTVGPSVSASVAATPATLLGPGNYYFLASVTGYSRQHISRVLSGHAGCSLLAAQKLADAAGVSLDQLSLYIHDVRERNPPRYQVRKGRPRLQSGLRQHILQLAP